MIGLNVGSGQRRFTSTPEIEWINIDKVYRPGHEPDLVCDGAHLPYDDNSVDYVVLHHVLEHFGCGEAVSLIAEAYRVLNMNGALQVFVPDVRALSTSWLGGKLETQIFMTNLYGAYMGDEADRHRWGFDMQSLDRFLWQWTWKTAHYACPVIQGADVARDWWILEMECIK